MLNAQDFFDLSNTVFKELFEDTEYVWDALRKIKVYAEKNISCNVSGLPGSGGFLPSTVVLVDGKVLTEGFSVKGGEACRGCLEVVVEGQVLKGATVIYAGASLMGEDIYIGKGTVIETGALIKGPAYIGDNTEVRQGAYLRGNVLVGNGCVVGHTTEIKSSIMLGESKAGHFAYIGDSILGKVNLGAGTKLANLKVMGSDVVLRIDGKVYDTGLRKFGAVIGDRVETGCNTVTSPGTFLSPDSATYPNSTIRGYYPAGSVIKVRQAQEIQKKRA